MAGFSSKGYWEGRYAGGGNSGAGSYGRLAVFKADFINQFIELNGVKHVVDFGCGDGAQLRMLTVPHYVGVDVSKTILEKCRKEFYDDRYTFVEYDGLIDIAMAELVLSIDVIFHLVEDTVFETYMRNLFCFALKHVVIYSSDYDATWPAEHVRHRSVVKYVEQMHHEWNLVAAVKNPFKYDSLRPDHTSFCDFMVFGRRTRDETTMVPGNILTFE